MANQLPLLENLTKQDIKELMDACVNFDAKNILGSDYEEVISYNIPRLKLYWKTKIEFEKDIKFITGAKSIIEANKTLEKRMSSAPNKLPDANTIDSKQLKQFEEEAKTREEQIKKTRTEATRQVEDSLKRKQEIYQKLQESLKNKKVYAKVEATKPPPIPDENTQKFIEEAKAHPASFEKDLTENIRTKLTQSFSGKISNEEIDLIAKKTAYDTISAINSPQAQADAVNQTAILNALAKGNSIASKAIGDIQAESLIKDASTELSFFNNSTESSRNVLASVNENLATSVFGVDPNTLNVSFSEKPIDGQTHTVDFGQLSQGYQNLLDSQSEVLNNFSSLSKDQFQAYLMGRARTFLDAKIAKLPIDSALKGLYNSKFGQQVLSFVGLEKFTPFKGELWGSIIQKIPGASGFLEGLGGKLGIDFGISGLTSGAETGISTIETITAVGQGAKLSLNVTIGNAIARGAASLLGKIGMTAASAKMGAMVGTGIIPVIGTVVGAIAGALFGKLAEKIDWSKVKKALPWILGGLVGVPVFVLVGPVAGIIAGVGTFGLLSAAGGPAGLSVAGTGLAIALLLKRFGKGFFSVAVKPFLVFFLVAPFVVVIILFIINSGAYVVPPEQSLIDSANPYISIEKIANPNGQISSPTSVTYTITVNAKKEILTNISFTNTCQAIKASGIKTDCKSLEQIPPPPESVSPSIPYSFTFTSNYDGSYKDSLVTDTITITAKTTSGETVTETGSASVCFGSCPLDCFDLNDSSWNGVLNYKATLTNAAATLASEYPNFAAKACSGGQVKLCYVGSLGSFYGKHIHTPTCDIQFTKGALSNDNDALFLLTHEATHHIQNIAGSYTASFIQKVFPYEPSVCTYGGANAFESMAEGNALYVARPDIDMNASCLSNYKLQYPKHYSFAKDVMFGQ